MALGHANDFLVYWQAGRDLVHEGWVAVYDISTLTPFKYHPAFAIGFAPWGLLPALAARILWAALHGALVFDLQRRWSTAWGLDAAAIGMGFLGVAHALTWQVKFGNVTFVMLWLWTMAVTTAVPWRRAAGYAMLIALKPYWLVLGVPWAFGRRWRLAGQVAAGLVLVSLLPLLLGPSGFVEAYDRWFATFADPAHAHNYPKTDNQGWYGLLARHEATLGASLPWLWLAGSGLVALLWLAAWWKRRATHAGQEELAARELTTIPLFLWASPLSWIHHQLLLWPLMAWLWRTGRSRRPVRGAWLGTWVLLNGLTQAILGRPLSRVFLKAGVPLAAFPLLTWVGGRALAGEMASGTSASGSHAELGS